MRSIYVAMMAFVLVNCGHVPLSSIPKLKQLNVLTLDVQQLRVAVAMPDGLRVRKGSAVIIIGVRKTADEPALMERIILRETPVKERTNTTSDLPAGAQIFRIAGADVPRLESIRAAVRTRQQDDPDGTKGYLTVTSGACRSNALPNGPLLVNTWLRTDDDDTFFALTRNVDLRAVIPADKLQTEVPACK